MLLEFALGEAETFVFVVRKGGVKDLVKIPQGREELGAKVKAFMAPLINREPDRLFPGAGSRTLRSAAGPGLGGGQGE